MMKTILVLAALALPAFGQSFDFSLLDKVGTNAKNKSEVNLDPNMMKLASGIMGKDKNYPGVANLVASLTGVTVRSFEFDAPGRYNEADLDPFRAFLKQQKWSRIVDSKEDKEHSEIYTLSQGEGKVGGIAIISAEAREVTVVYISGSINVEDIGRLSENMGIPNIGLTRSRKMPPPPPPPGKKEE